MQLQRFKKFEAFLSSGKIVNFIGDVKRLKRVIWSIYTNEEVFDEYFGVLSW